VKKEKKMIYKDGVLDDLSRNITAELKAEEIKSIETLIQEKLNHWCRANKHKTGDDLILTVTKLLGQNQFKWEDTVLHALTTWHDKHKSSSGNASMDSGNMLWNVLLKDTRRFYTDEESKKTPREYRWDGK
jgi:hypothetical protein